jgi:tripartite-type tricarboxylate transporter receptor subunit TctC
VQAAAAFLQSMTHQQAPGKEEAPNRDWNVMRRSLRPLGSILLAICSLACAVPASAQAQYPAKPIKVIVPYAPGGLTDVVARHYAEQVRRILGQAVVVENKPGASGILAIEEMARARPDGYTIMIGNISTNGLTPVLLRKKMSIDYDKDVQIVARLADVPVFFLGTTSGFPPKTFAEFIDCAKTRPGEVRYASAGIGAYQHVNTEILAKRAGLNLLHIPFKDGGPAILANVANGDTQVSWFNITNPVGMMQRGRVRALAVAAPQRLADHPDVPTIAEVGFPGLRAAQWVAAFAPARTPPEIVATLHGAFVDALRAAEVQEAFRKGGMTTPSQSSADDAKAWLQEEMASWRRDLGEITIAIDE